MADSNKEVSKSKSSSSTKWIVIGIIAVLSIFLFRDSIRNLLDNTSELEVSSTGIKIKTITKQTPAGNVIVSGPPTNATAGITAETAGDNSTSDAYKINYTQVQGWHPNESMAASNNVDFHVEYSGTSGYQSRIEVRIEEVGTMSIDDFIEMGNHTFDGRTYDDKYLVIDSENNAAMRFSQESTSDGIVLFYIERIIIYNDKAYIAEGMAESTKTSEVEDIRKILNSFRVP